MLILCVCMVTYFSWHAVLSGISILLKGLIDKRIRGLIAHAK